MKPQKTAVLFPGQGSQFLGMGQGFFADPEARQLLEAAEEVSGFPIRRLCQEGPLEELTRTLHLQPALTAVNLVCWQAVRQTGLQPDFAAGHSLGEYSALCAAAVLTPEDTLRLVTERGRLMERESQKHPGSMRAVLGLTLAQVQALLADLPEGLVVAAANHNSEKQVVISGGEAALETAAAAAGRAGGKVIGLKVSGAWHSPLVQEAVPDFEQVMARTQFQAPAMPLLFNATAREETEPAAIRQIMASQLSSLVRWHEIVEALVAREVRLFVEVGPKTVLTGLLKKIIPASYPYRAVQVDSPQGLERLQEELAKI